MTATQVQLPELDQATALRDQVYVDRFFAKLAEFGVQPFSQEEASQMLQDAYQLDQIPEEKAAATNADGFYQRASARLNSFLSTQGGPPLSKQAEQQNAAVAYAQHPDVYKSVLTHKAAAVANQAQAQEAR